MTSILWYGSRKSGLALCLRFGKASTNDLDFERPAAAAVRKSSLTGAGVLVGTVATHPLGAARRKLRRTGARLEQRQASAGLGQCVLPTDKAKVVDHELVAGTEAGV